jgi:hypothetical protein
VWQWQRGCVRMWQRVCVLTVCGGGGGVCVWQCVRDSVCVLAVCASYLCWLCVVAVVGVCGNGSVCDRGVAVWVWQCVCVLAVCSGCVCWLCVVVVVVRVCGSVCVAVCVCWL